MRRLSFLPWTKTSKDKYFNNSVNLRINNIKPFKYIVHPQQSYWLLPNFIGLGVLLQHTLPATPSDKHRFFSSPEKFVNNLAFPKPVKFTKHFIWKTFFWILLPMMSQIFARGHQLYEGHNHWKGQGNWFKMIWKEQQTMTGRHLFLLFLQEHLKLN